MIAYLIVKKVGFDQSVQTTGSKIGDIIDVLPTPNMGVEAMNYFRAVEQTLKIPCGDGLADAAGIFTMGERGSNWDCGVCKYNDPDDCDRTKYKRCEFSKGTLLSPPEIIQKRIYSMDEAGNIMDTRA